ncbi:glycosyltransferase family 2 protein [Nakamurella leprariae]|uniref:Glycosyltransferase family 2 protein n=1 Tax=Nakamurella leprariae TaxID=2803911 RepID=A0A939C3J3_9ACTN|nr:glycosyltransferase family 2 protein [Nakamurella leprariae]MBM9469152.1 glycosyltransferase family 2 protein [Nakamurella leprariae]
MIIVAYHSRDLVLRCLDALAADLTAERVHVTVLDNSRDTLLLHRLGDRAGVTGIDMGGNTGFARACNRGIALGAAPAVLLLNPDTVVAEDAIDTLLRFLADHPDAGVVAPALRNPDGSDQRTARRFPTAAAAVFGRRSVLTRLWPGNRWSGRYLLTDQVDRSRPFRADWVSGAAMLVPRAVIDRVGGLDEGYFLFWEDADWCRRIRSAGLDVWVVPDAVVTHDEGGTRNHGWSTTALRSFHRGAYRYWRLHAAPQWWNPLRWAAAAALTARAAVLIAESSLRDRSLIRRTGAS